MRVARYRVSKLGMSWFRGSKVWVAMFYGFEGLGCGFRRISGSKSTGLWILKVSGVENEWVMNFKGFQTVNLGL